MSSKNSDLDQSLEKASGLEAARDKKAEQALVHWAEEMFSRSRQGRLPFERQWYVNMAFYFGKQYVQWQASGATGQLSRLWEPPVPAWRVRLVCNKIKPIVRTELAKITKEKATAFVMPATSDDDDLVAAQAAESIYEHISRDLGYHKIMRRAAFWTLICGSGFIKDWYDPNSLDSSGVKGAIKAEPVSPFHLFAGDYADETIEGQPHLIHVVSKSPDWVLDNFGKVVAADAGGANGMLETKFLSAIGVQTASRPTQVAVKEMWVRPGAYARFPKGAHIMWAGDVLLSFKDKWPYDHQEFPFSKIDHIPTGRFYGDSTIVDLIPLQKEYNRTRSQIIEAKNRMSKPQLLAPRGSVDASKVTSEPGLIIFYTPGFTPPSPLQLQDIPSYVIQELERIQRDMDDISSQHEVTKGRTPPGVEAATAIAYLQEEDDSKLAYTVTSMEEAIERLGKHTLSHVKQFWTAQRTVRVVGDSGMFESFVFSGSDVRGNTDLRIEAGSATPRSKAAKQAFITELGKLGWITPDRALRYLDMAETGRLYEEMQVDARQAQRENLRMAAGDNTVTVNEWDEHMVHIAEHNLFRKKQAFEKLPDEVKVFLNMHVTFHQQIVALMMGQQLMPGDPQLQAIVEQQKMMIEQGGAMELGSPPGAGPPGPGGAPPPVGSEGGAPVGPTPSGPPQF